MAALVQAAVTAQERERSSRDGRAAQAARFWAAASSSQRTRALGPLVTWKQLGATRDAGGLEEREIEREGQNDGFFSPFDEG